MKFAVPHPLHLRLCLLLCLVPIPGEAARDVPAISLTRLKKALQQGNVTLVDVNGTTMFRKGHIPTAIDYRPNRARLASLLPRDKSQLVVAYCGGPQCNAYRTAAEKLVELGYTNVRYFPEGITGWIRAGQLLERPP